MEDKIKLFAMSNQMAERTLDYVERDLKIDLGRGIGTAEEEGDE